MLKILSYKTISKNSDLFFSQFQLRNREYLERQRYDVKFYNGMEFDEYDNLSTQYIVYTEDNKTVLGLSRFTPIETGCMLQDHFPELVDDHTLFSRSNIWEGTRCTIDSRLPAELRRRICIELACGYVEFGLHVGADRIIGVMPTLILRSVFERNGITLDRLGNPQMIGDHKKVQAAAINISPHHLENVERLHGVSDVLGLGLYAQKGVLNVA